MFLRYPSAEEVSAIKAELDRVKVKLGQKEAECMEAEANAKKSEALVKKMQVQDRIARIRSEARKDKDRSESHQQDIIARAIVHWNVSFLQADVLGIHIGVQNEETGPVQVG